MSKLDGASRIAELRRSISTVDRTAFLVEPRVIRRIIRELHGFAKLSANLPHAQSQVTSSRNLSRFAHPDELGLDDFSQLPETCLLISEPTEGELEHWPIQELKQQLWRRLFHAQLDRQLNQLQSDHDPSFVLARIDEIGQVEFDEAHFVLRNEHRLLTPSSRAEAWREFVATYLELLHFEPDLISTWFPSLIGKPNIEDLVSRELPVLEWFEASRLPGASAPDLASHSAIDDEKLLLTRRNWSLGLGNIQSDRSYLRQLRRRDRAKERGNTVAAASSAMEASQRATSEGKRKLAEDKSLEEVRHLVHRLQASIEFPEEDCEEWQAALGELVKNSIHGFWNSEKRLLYDLQKVCLDHERVTYKIDLVKWMVSRGRRPLRRPLSNLREVSMAKHLASAASRLVYVRLSGIDRERLNDLIQNAAALSEAQMRERMRPVLQQTLLDVKLAPTNIPEQVAFDKLVEDSLDCIASRGYLTMGYLRDAISKNDLKLPDLEEARELWRGDRLLQSDDRLDVALDGVYRRGDFYLRWLQMVSSVFFGTRVGRFATLYLLLPFGGSILIVEGVQHVVHVIKGKDEHADKSSADDKEVTLNPSSTEIVQPNENFRPSESSGDESDSNVGLNSSATDFLGIDSTELVSVPPRTTDEAVDQILSRQTDTISIVLILGFLLMALIHVRDFRQLAWNIIRRFAQWTRFTVVDLPWKLIRLPWVQRIWKSTPFVRFRQVILTPAIVTYALTTLLPPALGSSPLDWWWSLIIGVLLSTTLNSRMGQDAQELTTEWLGSLWHKLRAQLLIAIFDWIVDFFRWLLHLLERLLYAVDEWLRFHSHENWLSIVIKAILGVLWSLVSFLIRIYVNLLIEPTFHPVKHFPVVTVAHKIFLPALIMLEGNMVHFLGQYLGTPLARSITWFNIFFLPGFFGFAVWELKENWRLFAANRKRKLEPITVGSHGETVARLLRPGFHSGTLPKVFRRLRRIEQREASFRRFVIRRATRQQLHHVEHAVHNVVTRELIRLLELCPAWSQHSLRCNHVDTSTNSLSIELECPTIGDTPFRLAIQEQSGWVVAGILQYGWMQSASSEQVFAMENALEGFYRKCGVDLVREQITHNVAVRQPYDVDSNGLVIWSDATCQQSSTIDLRGPGPIQMIRERILGDVRSTPIPVERDQIVFSATSTYWTEWVDLWTLKERLTTSRLPDACRHGTDPPVFLFDRSASFRRA